MVILATVGVGQTEYAVRGLVDTLVLVLMPESGDQIQTMKAGLMETADIYVVNKADLPNARGMTNDVRGILARGTPWSTGWRPTVVEASSGHTATVEELSHLIDPGVAGRIGRSDCDHPEEAGASGHRARDQTCARVVGG